MYKREGKPVCGPTDFRSGINCLITRLKELMQDLFSNNMYVFCSKTKDKIKTLYLGEAGLILYRLEKGKFRWFKNANIQAITYKQMEWLLDGLDITHNHNEY